MYNVIAHLKQFYITFILQTIELGSFHVKSRLLQFSSSAISDFDNIFTVYVCVYVCMYLCMYVRYCIGTHCAKFCSNILSILFWQNFKDVRSDPVYHDLQIALICSHIQPYITPLILQINS